MPPHSEQIVSRICGALFRGSLTLPSSGLAYGEPLKSNVRRHRRFSWRTKRTTGFLPRPTDGVGACRLSGKAGSFMALRLSC
ncbi:hypothetical protein EYR26_21725 [Xanthomonas oryzae]|nr:hypothetical protein EYR26_21725 [Xanthomonas oryzae]QBH05293.1 hypothetical protein EYC57_20705 [Xanthomonas oryzae]